MFYLNIFCSFIIILKIVNCDLINHQSDSINIPSQENNEFIQINTNADDAKMPSRHRNKRFASILTKAENKNYQQCITPTGSKGHCKLLHYCSLAELKQNVLKIFDYLCIIEQSAIGVCCPDELAEKPGPPAINLPEKGDDLPVWKSDGDDVQSDVRPENRGCGLSTKSFPKITGGRPADPKEWPWMAAIMLHGNPKIYCGGSVITDRHVLTAAHCVNSLPKEEIAVRLGEYDFRSLNETRIRDFNVTEIRIHVDYNKILYENDIAVLKLDRPTIFNSYIWPVCMPPYGETWNGYQAVVIGWGTQFFSGPNSNILMEVTVPVWQQERCKEAFGLRIFDSNICAGDGGRDSCQNDSGGPLMVRLPNKRWAIVGIVSWGINCGQANHPGVYTRVNSFTDWIIENSVF